ncbi:sugar phosphate isomerase/epimerase family protein [Roseibium litorale]|uniref:Sugar phosphate isomerase/epimerase n=1 Tax=Roseibium litorale TaxID=2803841 RepID=A0ABR9CKZ8_9HYPH|nr:sugar phosphate isomerase/epimerase [Roseibium litorale]MBD8891011.1 sugar phosphate isomerase/epimerase [Roseibium litorale]
MPRPLSAAHLSAIDLDPPAFLEAAADAGFDAVGLRLIRVTETTPGYPLMHDPDAMRQTKAAMASTGLRVADIEFVKITPETCIDALLPFLDAGAELGAAQVITAPYDPDLNRLANTLGRLSEQAHLRGLGTVLEFFPWTCVPNLAACWKVVSQAGPHTGLLVDSLHFNRSGSQLDMLRSLPRDRLPFAHLCDAPCQPGYTEEELLETARAERLAPGDGDIDLKAFLAALAQDLPLGIEVPMTRMAAAEGSAAVLKHICDRTKGFLATFDDCS